MTSYSGNIDALIEGLRRGILPSEVQVRQICMLARQLLLEEANVLSIEAPVSVCGDIHGQF